MASGPVDELRAIFESLPGVIPRWIQWVAFGGDLPRADVARMRAMAAQLRAGAADLDGHAVTAERVLAQQDSLGEFGDGVRGSLRQLQEGGGKLREQAAALADQADAAANEAEKTLCVMLAFGVELGYRIIRILSAAAASGPAGQLAAVPAVEATLADGRGHVEALRAVLKQAYQRIAAQTAARVPSVSPSQFAVTVVQAAALPAGVDAGVQGAQTWAGYRDLAVMGADGSNPTGIDLTAIEVAAVAGAAGAGGGMAAARFGPSVFPAMQSSPILAGLVHGTTGGVFGLGAATLITGWPQHVDQMVAPLLNGGFAGAVHARAGAPSHASTGSRGVDGSGGFIPPETVSERAGAPRPSVEILRGARQAWEAARTAWRPDADPASADTPALVGAEAGGGTQPEGSARAEEPGSVAAGGQDSPPPEVALSDARSGDTGSGMAPPSSGSETSFRTGEPGDGSPALGYSSADPVAESGTTEGSGRRPSTVDTPGRIENHETAASTGGVPETSAAAGEHGDPVSGATGDSMGRDSTAGSGDSGDTTTPAGERGSSAAGARGHGGEQSVVAGSPGEVAPARAGSATGADQGRDASAVSRQPSRGDDRPSSGQPARTTERDGPGEPGLAATQGRSVSVDESAGGYRPPRVDPEILRGVGETYSAAGEHPAAAHQRDSAGADASEGDPRGTGEDVSGDRSAESGESSDAEASPSSRNDADPTARPDPGALAHEVLADFHARSSETITEYLRLSNLSDEALQAGLFHPNERESLIATMEIIRRQTVSENVPGGMVLRAPQLEGLFRMEHQPVQMLPGQGKTLMFMAYTMRQAVDAYAGHPGAGDGSVLLVTTTDGLAYREFVEYRRVMQPYGIDVLRADQQTGFGDIRPGRPAIVVATGETVGHLTNAGHTPPRSVVIDEMDGIVDRGLQTFIRSERAAEEASEATREEVVAADTFLQDALTAEKLSYEDFGVKRLTETYDVQRPSGTFETKVQHWYEGKATLTPEGRARVAEMPGGERWLQGMGLSRLEIAASAEFTTHNKTHYVISNGKIVIIGQTEHGLQYNPKTSGETRWSAEDGKASLAQAVEAKELRLAEKNGHSPDEHRIAVRADAGTDAKTTAAEIYRTGGDFFDRVTGASGTLSDLGDVLNTVYGLDTPHEVAPYNPSKLIQGTPDVHENTHAKLKAIAEYAHELRENTGRFQLVLCDRNDLVDKQVTAMLKAGIPREAIEAVDADRVTGWDRDWLDATTDIDSETQLQNIFDAAGERDKILVINRQGQRGVDISISDDVLARGGMHVWLTEVPEQSYVYDQATNRTARNGQPGTAQALMSPQDTLIRDALHLRGVREAVVTYEQAAKAVDADDTPQTRSAVTEARDGLTDLVSGLQHRAHVRSTAEFLHHNTEMSKEDAQLHARRHNPGSVDQLDDPADRNARLAGLLGIPTSQLTNALGDNALDTDDTGINNTRTDRDADADTVPIRTDESRDGDTGASETDTTDTRSNRSHAADPTDTRSDPSDDAGAAANRRDPAHNADADGSRLGRLHDTESADVHTTVTRNPPAGISPAAAEALRQQVDATAPGQAARYALLTNEEALDYLLPRRNRLAAELGVETEKIEGAEGLRHVGAAADTARYEFFEALKAAAERRAGTDPYHDDVSAALSEVTTDTAREKLGEAIAANLSAAANNRRSDTDTGPSADSTAVDAAVTAAASHYLATAAMLDLITEIHRSSPNSCVNNGVSAMRVLCPQNADNFTMPRGGPPLQGHDWDTVTKSFRNRLPTAHSSLDEAKAALERRPGGVQVLVYKWKNNAATPPDNKDVTDADNHLILLVNDSDSADRPNLVAVDLSASRGGNYDNNISPKDLTDRRALLDKAVPFDTWQREQQKFIARVPESARVFWTIDFDKSGEPVSDSGPRGEPAAERTSGRVEVPDELRREIEGRPDRPTDDDENPDSPPRLDLSGINSSRPSDISDPDRRPEPAGVGSRPHVINVNPFTTDGSTGPPANGRVGSRPDSRDDAEPGPMPDDVHASRSEFSDWAARLTDDELRSRPSGLIGRRPPEDGHLDAPVPAVAEAGTQQPVPGPEQGEALLDWGSRAAPLVALADVSTPLDDRFVADWLAEHDEQVREWRRHIFHNPRASGNEYDTAQFVFDVLQEAGLDPQLVLDGRGVICDFGPEDGERIALRGDMDALKLDVDGEEKVLHACGHDSHTAMVLAAGQALASNSARLEQLGVQVRLVFQPAEETVEGAKEMVEAGLLDGTTQAFALHTDPRLKAGEFGVVVGPMNASADKQTVKFEGRHTGHAGMNAPGDKFAVDFQGPGGHTAHPEETADLIRAMSEFAATLHTLLTGHVGADGKIETAFGKLRAGEKMNVVPDYGRVEGMIRRAAVKYPIVHKFLEQRLRELKQRFDGLTYALDYEPSAGAEGRLEKAGPTVDVIQAITEFIHDLDDRITERFGQDGTSVTVFGKVDAEHDYDASTGAGTVSGTIRRAGVEKEDVEEFIKKRLAELEKQFPGLKTTPQHDEIVPTVINDSKSILLFLKGIASLGPDAAVAISMSMGGDDFAWILNHVPRHGAYVNVGIWPGKGKKYSLHQPPLGLDVNALDERALYYGARALAGAVLAAGSAGRSDAAKSDRVGSTPGPDGPARTGQQGDPDTGVRTATDPEPNTAQPGWRVWRLRHEVAMARELYHRPESRRAAVAMLDRLRAVLTALHPEATAEQINSAFYAPENTNAGGMVLRSVPLDELRADGNLRELMAAVYNAMLRSGELPEDPATTTLDDGVAALLNRVGWEKEAANLGLDVEALGQVREWIVDRNPQGETGKRDIRDVRNTVRYPEDRTIADERTSSSADEQERDMREQVRRGLTVQDWAVLGMPLSLRELEAIPGPLVKLRISRLAPQRVLPRGVRGRVDADALERRLQAVDGIVKRKNPVRFVLPLYEYEENGRRKRDRAGNAVVSDLLVYRDVGEVEPEAALALDPDRFAVPLPWGPGVSRVDLDKGGSWFREHAIEQGFPLLAGLSGTAARFAARFKWLRPPGVSDTDFAGAIMAFLSPQHHSLYEQVRGMQMSGLHLVDEDVLRAPGRAVAGLYRAVFEKLDIPAPDGAARVASISSRTASVRIGSRPDRDSHADGASVERAAGMSALGDGVRPGDIKHPRGVVRAAMRDPVQLSRIAALVGDLPDQQRAGVLEWLGEHEEVVLTGITTPEKLTEGSANSTTVGLGKLAHLLVQEFPGLEVFGRDSSSRGVIESMLRNHPEWEGRIEEVLESFHVDGTLAAQFESFEKVVLDGYSASEWATEKNRARQVVARSVQAASDKVLRSLSGEVLTEREQAARARRPRLYYEYFDRDGSRIEDGDPETAEALKIVENVRRTQREQLSFAIRRIDDPTERNAALLGLLRSKSPRGIAKEIGTDEGAARATLETTALALSQKLRPSIEAGDGIPGPTDRSPSEGSRGDGSGLVGSRPDWESDKTATDGTAGSEYASPPPLDAGELSREVAEHGVVVGISAAARGLDTTAPAGPDVVELSVPQWLYRKLEAGGWSPVQVQHRRPAGAGPVATAALTRGRLRVSVGWDGAVSHAGLVDRSWQSATDGLRLAGLPDVYAWVQERNRPEDVAAVDWIKDWLLSPDLPSLPERIIERENGEVTEALYTRWPQDRLDELGDPDIRRGIRLAADGLFINRTLYGDPDIGRANQIYDDAFELREYGVAAFYYNGMDVAADLGNLVDNGLLQGAEPREIVWAVAVDAWSDVAFGGGRRNDNLGDYDELRSARLVHDRARSNGLSEATARILGFAVNATGFDERNKTQMIASPIAVVELAQQWGPLSPDEFARATRIARWVAAAKLQTLSDPEALVQSIELALEDLISLRYSPARVFGRVLNEWGERVSAVEEALRAADRFGRQPSEDGHVTVRQAVINRLRDNADFLDTDTGYRPPEGWLLGNRDMRREHAARLREITARLAGDPTYTLLDAHGEAQAHASEMRDKHSDFGGELVVRPDIEGWDSTDIAADVADRLPDSVPSELAQEFIDAIPRIGDLVRSSVDSDPVLVVTSVRDGRGRPRLVGRLSYIRWPGPYPGVPVSLDLLRRRVPDVNCRVDRSDPLSNGQVRESIEFDFTGRRGSLADWTAPADDDATALPAAEEPGGRINSRLDEPDDSAGPRHEGAHAGSTPWSRQEPRSDDSGDSPGSNPRRGEGNVSGGPLIGARPDESEPDAAAEQPNSAAATAEVGRPQFRVESTETVYSGPTFDMLQCHVRMPDGRVLPRDVIDVPATVAVLPVDRQGRALLTSRFRPVVGAAVLELPTGLPSADEEPLQAAQRILAASGLRAGGAWSLATDMVRSGGLSNAVTRVLVAREVEGIDDVQPAPTLLRMPLEEAIAQVVGVDTVDSAAAVGVLAAAAETFGDIALRPATDPPRQLCAAHSAPSSDVADEYGAQPLTPRAETTMYRSPANEVRRVQFETPDGDVVEQDMVARRSAVMVLPWDERTDEVVLVRQYRPALDRWVLQLPAGTLDKSGEDPLTGIRRELAEEAGVAAQEWGELVNETPLPWISSERRRIYLARNLSAVSRPDSGESDEIGMRQVRMPASEALDLATSGEIDNGAAVFGLLSLVAVKNGWLQPRAVGTTSPSEQYGRSNEPDSRADGDTIGGSRIGSRPDDAGRSAVEDRAAGTNGPPPAAELDKPTAGQQHPDRINPEPAAEPTPHSGQSSHQQPAPAPESAERGATEEPSRNVPAGKGSTPWSARLWSDSLAQWKGD